MCTSKSSTFCAMNNCSDIFSQAAHTCIKLNCTKQFKASNIW